MNHPRRMLILGKKLYITEKPSVAASFATVLSVPINQSDRGRGYAETSDSIVSWCYGHLVTMSFPDAYNPEYKKWKIAHLPIIPETYQYSIIPDKSSAKQYHVLQKLLQRPDVDEIYSCTDSGREGEYIFRLVYAQSGSTKPAKRVWISAQTEDAVKKGILEAKNIQAYDNLAKSAYCRAKEDWLFGMNFSRMYTCQYGRDLSVFLKTEKSTVVAIGRVMTCVLGLIVQRDLEIRRFVPKTNYAVVASFLSDNLNIAYKGRWQKPKVERNEPSINLAESDRHNHEAEITKNELTINKSDAPMNKGKTIAKENETTMNEDNASVKENKATTTKGKTGTNKTDIGTSNPNQESSAEDDALTKEEAQELIQRLEGKPAFVKKVEIKVKKEPPPMLFNLAELQSEANKRYKMPVDRVLEIAQNLYEKKLISYPRTDSRVLATEVVPEIPKILNGLFGDAEWKDAVTRIKDFGALSVTKTSKRFVDDNKVTDHYAIIPTYLTAGRLESDTQKIYMLIVKRFLAIFYPSAEYNTVKVETDIAGETFITNSKTLKSPGWKEIYDVLAKNEEELSESPIQLLKKKDACKVTDFELEEKETKPPPRFTDGSLILTMEKAGKYIENEELRAQIKTSGIGTSATRSSIIKKLKDIGYIHIQAKTQIITPTKKGEAIVSLVSLSAKDLLNPALTASWEKGLAMVQSGETSEEVFLGKLNTYIRRTIDKVKLHGDAGKKLNQSM